MKSTASPASPVHDRRDDLRCVEAERQYNSFQSSIEAHTRTIETDQAPHTPLSVGSTEADDHVGHNECVRL